MKRTRSFTTYHTRSKKIKLLEPPKAQKKKYELPFVSASSTYNYMMKDPLVDWLKVQNNNSRLNIKSKFTFGNFLIDRGIDFEKSIISYINDNHLPIISVSTFISKKTVQTTKELMKEGIPIIHSAPVRNTSNNTQGIVDLIVRSDYLHKFINDHPLTLEEQQTPSPKLNKPYHYVVIDIKFSTLPLRSDGKSLLNSGNYKAYKSQCLIYNDAVGKIQGYTPPYAFILGRRWKYTKNGITDYCYNSLDKLGRIEYDNFDKGYVKETKKALQWARSVKKYGKKWTVNPPSRIELYPNMCIKSDKWDKEKDKIAKEIGEMTDIWYINQKNRNIAISKGIKSWRDTRCTTSNLEIKGVRAPIIDAILNINRQNKIKILPKKITSNIYDWKIPSNEVYVDFETLTDIFSDFNQLPEQQSTDMIFMIGIGWKSHNSWEYKNFVCSDMTYQEEYRIMNEFVEFIKSMNNPKIYYWCAEAKFWDIAERRQFDIACKEDDIEKKDIISDNWSGFEWSDLYTLFRQEPITIKGCFKFSLKEIAKAMKKHNFIQTDIQSQCDNGTTAMVNAIKHYTSRLNKGLMQDIGKYNEFDCKVLWEIVSYLRENHS